VKANGHKPKVYRGPALMAAAEIASLFDVKTQLVNQWRKASTFPAPAELSCGRIWLEREILAWAKRYRPDLYEVAMKKREAVTA
jgi:predicted DNA-binding transcriptional regulator AlpA